MAGIYSIPPRIHNIFIISLSLCGTVRADVWWIVMRQRDGGWQCCSPRDHVPASQVTLSRGVTSHVTRMDRHKTSQAAQQIVEVRTEHLQTEQLRSISAVFEHLNDLNIWTGCRIVRRKVLRLCEWCEEMGNSRAVRCKLSSKDFSAYNLFISAWTRLGREKAAQAPWSVTKYLKYCIEYRD